MIADGMQPLGTDYVQTMRRGCLEERWVDYAINRGKSEGAFSYGTYDSHPFIMLSFDGSLGAMSTLAHEIGHSMHSWYTRKHQPFVYSNYSMFAAEVASNFNQAMVRARLFAGRDDRDFQLALIQEAMDNIHRYFFIMPTLARFELEVHSRMENDELLTPAALNEIMAGYFAEGYGESMTDDPRRTGITWAQFGHLYEAFYTFQYATGIFGGACAGQWHPGGGRCRRRRALPDIPAGGRQSVSHGRAAGGGRGYVDASRGRGDLQGAGEPG